MGGLTQLRGFHHRLLHELSLVVEEDFPGMRGEDDVINQQGQLLLQVQGAGLKDEGELEKAKGKIK